MSDTWWLDEKDLDDEQRAVISLPPRGNYLIVGPPGSGKTNLLLLRASYLAGAQQPNVRVLMFTKTLREFVSGGTNTYAVSRDKIQTIMAWEYGLLREHMVDVPPEKLPFEQKRLEYVRGVASLFKKKPALEGHLHCILVDEVQDCLPEEIEVFFQSAKQVFFVGDDRQEIYGKNAIIESLVRAKRVHKVELTKHYRNGHAICQVADEIGKNFGEDPLFGSCNYDEEHNVSSVDFESCVDNADLIRKLVARVQKQLAAYPGELIGIACPRREDAATMREALSGSKLKGKVLDVGRLEDLFDTDRRIAICTMHEAKGLECRALHLPYVEHVKRMKAVQKKLAFTATTRAKTALVFYSIEPLPPYLEAARETVAPRKPPPRVADLFPRKK